MKTISQGLGFEKIMTLSRQAEPDVEEQKTIKATPEIERIDPTELEYAYKNHPIVFNSINKSTQAIMSAGWELKSKDEKVLSYFQNFIDKVGKVGEIVTFEEILESIFQYQMIYGNAYLETVLNKYKNNIVDLVILDPKRIDYAKTSDTKIALDKYGKPVGYVQKLPYNVSAEGKGDKIPEGVDISLLTNEIFLLPERICHFKLYTYGDRFYGQGLIESAHSSIMYEMNIRKEQANSQIKNSLVDFVGDTLHEPTPQQITNALDKMKKFKSNRFFAFPYWHRIDQVEVKPNETTKDFLEYLRQDIGASLGMPMAFALGSGEKTNRATLKTQQLFLTFTLNDVVKRTLSTFHKFVFDKICEYNKFKTKPEIVWGHIGVEELDLKASRLVSYAKAGLLDVETAKAYITKSERL